MSQTIDDQMPEVIMRGLANYVNATDDTDYLPMGYITYRDVKDVFIENIRPGDTCLLAFPSMVILPEIRVECFVAVLNDRVIIAWRKGLFMKKMVSRVIPKHTIKQASWAVVNRPGMTRGNTIMLTIIADGTIALAMPKDKPAVADAIVAALRTSTEYTY
jgi:CBS domain-containing protein